ncbi:hypothetical protein PR048_026108 [Dryococelus australis]|uniref:Uncharacterized protein n=1 Tax=Dryococelus australis TaxID=614101 RepID=A0ABQ9GKH0_9NEOP|nr:hypothetical protein PR048_026108 [Dryococelus australis]
MHSSTVVPHESGFTGFRQGLAPLGVRHNRALRHCLYRFLFDELRARRPFKHECSEQNKSDSARSRLERRDTNGTIEIESIRKHKVGTGRNHRGLPAEMTSSDSRRATKREGERERERARERSDVMTLSLSLEETSSNITGHAPPDAGFSRRSQCYWKRRRVRRERGEGERDFGPPPPFSNLILPLPPRGHGIGASNSRTRHVLFSRASDTCLHCRPEIVIVALSRETGGNCSAVNMRQVASYYLPRWCYSPTTTKRVRFPTGLLPDFSTWESCLAMLLVGELSRGSPVRPTLSFMCSSISTSLHPRRLSRPRCSESPKYLHSSPLMLLWLEPFHHANRVGPSLGEFSFVSALARGVSTTPAVHSPSPNPFRSFIADYTLRCPRITIGKLRPLVRKGELQSPGTCARSTTSYQRR